MAKRKYDYLIYNDGKKERILNWFYADGDIKNRKIIIFTNSGIYLYVQDKTLLPFYESVLFEKSSYHPISSSCAFYELRGGVHNINIYDGNIWYAKDDIDRIEVIID